MNTITKIAIMLLTLLSLQAFSANYYVSPTGNNSNPGTQARPFATVQKAYDVAVSGDVIFLRGGTYTNFSVSSTDANYNYVHTISKSGISFLAFTGETPVLNFSSISTSRRVCAFLVTGSNNVFQGLELTGVPVGSQKQSEVFRVGGGNANQFKFLKIHDCPANGIYIVKNASNTLVENCDSYNLIGVSGTSAGNTDGFGCHSTGTGNIFRNCRAWNCSDDGYDCIHAAAAITYDHCWAYNNGANGGDGNGFKIGGWAATTPPAVVPVHRVQFCLSANNHSHGFYANHQPGQAANWYNNTSYNHNGGDFDMLERVSRTDATDIAGTREVMHNNLAYVGTLTRDLNESGSIVSRNSWTLSVSVSASDFQSVDPTQITRARQANGTLPVITFMHLTSGSDLINAGQNVGLPFTGSAPDLGCFETGSSGSSSLIMNPGALPLDEKLLPANVFPNPATNDFTINAPGKFIYTISNSAGLLIERGNGNAVVRAGSGLLSGSYVITIQTATATQSIKVVKM